MRRRIIFIIITCFLFLPALVTLVFATSERSTECSAVKVGYFDFPGYQNHLKNDEKSGYGYEYLQELKKYANWQYEYVYATYEECLELLKMGKIDLLTSVSYSEQRDEFFDYSKLPMGTKSSVLTVKDSNTKYISGEYSSFNGMRVGMLSGNISNKKFEKFSKDHNFLYTYDDSYSDVKELWKALQDGNVDAILTSNLRKPDNERIIAEFAPSPYYAIVRNNNQKLLYELNTAMEKINIITPIYQPILHQKYYGTDSMGSIAFSPEELDYIKKNPELSILIPPSMEPMAYSENGVAKGIEPDLIRKALEPSGLKLNLVTFDSSDKYMKEIEDTEKYPVIGLANDNAYQAEYNNLRLTAPYLTINYNIITKIGERHDNIIVAAVKEEPLVLNYVKKNYSPDQIKYYDNGNECVRAVLNGEATETIMNSYIAEHIIENDVRGRLVSNTIMGVHTDFAISVHTNTDYLLFSILNKCVNALSPDDARSILMKNTMYKNNPLSFVEYIYMYPTRVIFFVIIFFSVAISVIIISTRQFRIQKEQRAFEETEQFAKIATDANGEITELNLSDMLAISYSFIDKKLVKKERKLSAIMHNEKSYSDIIHPDDFPGYTEMFSKESLFEVAGNDLQKTCTLRMMKEDKKYYWTLFTLQGIPTDSSHEKNLIIFQKNIDDLKRKEALHEQQLKDALNTAIAASEAKGTFMSRMSHEIRTPLNAVIGYMAIAKNNIKNADKINDCVAKSEIAAKHLLSIINDVLDMSSIESGKLKMSHVRFDLRELISDISSVFYMQAQLKNVKFEVIINGVSEDFLIGDRLRVNQILLNILSNAVKFTPSGGSIYFTIEQNTINNNKVFIKFIVSDSGIGMTQEFKERLFEPFEQQDASIAQKYGGSGIGLSITKNLITMMNGVIDVESELNKGTTFRVELPFEKDSSVEKIDVDPHDFSHVKALIVDDELSACEYMNILMRRCGIKSEFALSGMSAVDMISDAYNSNNPFNMCLIDWKMPDMDGVETVKLIRECVGNDMPIIIVTAYNFSDIEENAREAGANLFVSKPLFQSTMLDLLVNTYGKYKVLNDKQNEEVYNFKDKRLLLAEDNEMNREIAVELLTQYGFIVDCAKDGKEAFEMFEKSNNGTYDAILMDIQMPIMNGYDTTKAIRESSHPEAENIPIIAMTANAFAEDIAASHSAGMNDHISKPIDITQMLSILKKYIN